MRVHFLFALFTLPCAGAITVAAQHTSAVTVVMSGLENPRGLTFGPEGGLYVAEAGKGPSDGSCFTNPEQPQCRTETPEGQTVFGCGCSTPNTSVENCAQSGGMLACSGPTGAVSRLWHGRQERVVTGLPSWAILLNGGRAEGPNDVAMLGRGEAFVTIGLEASPRLIGEMRNALGKDFGKLVRFWPNGKWQFVADLAAFLAAYEEEHPTRLPGLSIDSNPFGLLVEPGQRVVVDAGANALLGVAANGDISTLAVLPSLPQPCPCPTCIPPVSPTCTPHHPGVTDGDSVPTRIALGPDGAYYVGILTGVPFPDGLANIYRVVPGEPPDVAVVCTGFKAIIGLAFDAQGNLYVLQHSSDGDALMPQGLLYRIDSASLGNGCTRPSVPVLTGLTRPTAVIVGPDGALYVSNHGLGFEAGEVLRIEP